LLIFSEFQQILGKIDGEAKHFTRMQLLVKKKDRELAFSCQPEQDFPINKGYFFDCNDAVLKVFKRFV